MSFPAKSTQGSIKVVHVSILCSRPSARQQDTAFVQSHPSHKTLRGESCWPRNYEAGQITDPSGWEHRAVVVVFMGLDGTRRSGRARLERASAGAGQETAGATSIPRIGEASVAPHLSGAVAAPGLPLASTDLRPAVRHDGRGAFLPGSLRSGSLRQSIKAGLVTLGRPVVKAIWPGIESAAYLSTKLARPNSIVVKEYDEWSDELDDLLSRLPRPGACTREAYRQLCLPTNYKKRHFAVYDRGEPAAILSVRRRKNYWEAVCYQALSGFIAPARDAQALSDALRLAGVEISISAGLDRTAEKIGADVVYSYDVNVVDLTTDYEAHWRLAKRKQLNSVKKARRKCKDFEVVVDGPGDLEWGLLTWRDMLAFHMFHRGPPIVTEPKCARGLLHLGVAPSHLSLCQCD